MAALTADRMAKTRSDVRSFFAKMAANAVGYQKGLAAVNATGYAKAASSTPGERVIGYYASQADNTGGADGAIGAHIQTGAIKLDNDGTNPVTQADVGRFCYVKDDHTVQSATGAGSAPVAGRVDQIDADGGVWVNVDDAIGQISGKGVDYIPDNNTGAGIPVVHEFVIADAATADYDLQIEEKFEVIDVIVRKSGAGAGNTVQIKNVVAGVGTAITDAIAAAVDKTVTRAGTIDPAQEVVLAGNKLRASVTRAAGSGAMKVTVLGRKVA